jgi:PII-like signaling protein
MCTGAHPIGRGWSATRTPWITDLPLVVEIIDSEERITAFLPLLDGMVTGGLVSLEEIRILRYGPDKKET